MPGSAEKPPCFWRKQRSPGVGAGVSDTRGSDGSLAPSRGADARDLQQAVGVSGLDPAEL